MTAAFVIIACLATSPALCARFASDPVAAEQCLLIGPIAAQQWQDAHPAWIVQRWGCRLAAKAEERGS